MKTALVTGASGDIGQAIALQLAQQGYHLVLHYNRDETGMANLLQKLAAFSIDVHPVQADLSSPNGYQLIVDVVNQIDAIILASGKSHYGLVTDISATEVVEMVQLSFTSTFLLTQALLPKLISQKSGSIVLVTSIWGEIGASCEVLYSSLKGAQNTFVKGLAKEVAPSGVRVNAVSPGAIDTKMMISFSEEEKANLCEQIPLGRLGNVTDIANAVRFLLSDESAYMTGQVLRVNGGWLI